MRKTLNVAALFLLSFVLVLPGQLAASSKAAKGPTVPAAKALKLLREGNDRFIAGRLIHAHTSVERRKEVFKGQEPFATVLACADSRIPVERIFDHGFGDIFTVRTAGNFSQGANVIGTVEYGVLHTGTNAVVVLGHQSCGAVGGAMAGPGHDDEETHIPALLEYLKPGIDKAMQTVLKGPRLYDEAVRQNVWASIGNLLAKSPKISRLVHAKQVKVVGAVYSLETGRVEWLGSHPQESDYLIGNLQPYEE